VKAKVFHLLQLLSRITEPCNDSVIERGLLTVKCISARQRIVEVKNVIVEYELSGTLSQTSYTGSRVFRYAIASLPRTNRTDGN